MRWSQVRYPRETHRRRWASRAALPETGTLGVDARLLSPTLSLLSGREAWNLHAAGGLGGGDTCVLASV